MGSMIFGKLSLYGCNKVDVRSYEGSQGLRLFIMFESDAGSVEVCVDAAAVDKLENALRAWHQSRLEPNDSCPTVEELVGPVG